MTEQADKKTTVLVVDDEIYLLDLLASIVEELGHTVIRAANGTSKSSG